MKNNLTKTRSFEGINYGYCLKARSWKFEKNNFTYLTKCRGGEVADKVASILAGSFKRTGQVDGLARANISRVIG